MIYRRVVGYYGGGPKEPDEDAFGESPSSVSAHLTHYGFRSFAPTDTILYPRRHEESFTDRQGERIDKVTEGGNDWERLGSLTRRNSILDSSWM